MELQSGARNLVVVVDDDEDVREAVRDLLCGCANEIVTVENGVSACRVLQRMGARPCVVITDLEMPIMNGHELIRTLRANAALRHVRIVVLSSLGGITPGADENMRKPFDVEELRRTVRRLLGPTDVPSA
jgi:CheY-like chemotaxis protein